MSGLLNLLDLHGWPCPDILDAPLTLRSLTVAKQARELGNIPDALTAVQKRLDELKKSGSGGWGGKKAGLLGALRTEQPEGEVRDGLNKLLKEMDTSR